MNFVAKVLLFGMLAVLASAGRSADASEPADASLERVAPEDCVFYLAWSGALTPDPKSKNTAERFLADPEVQAVKDETIRRIKMLLDANPGDRGTEADRKLNAFLWKLGAAEPGAVYATHIDKKTSKPDGAVVIRVGDHQKQVGEFLSSFGTSGVIAAETKNKRADRDVVIHGEGSDQPTRLALRGDYVICAFGKESADAVVKRMGGKKPAWVGIAEQRQPIERIAMRLHVDLAAFFSAYSDDDGLREMAKVIRSFDLSTGLDGEDYVSRAVVGLDPISAKLAQGLFHQPLAPPDLAAIPSDAWLALSMRFDPHRLRMALESRIRQAKDSAADAAGSPVVKDKPAEYEGIFGAAPEAAKKDNIVPESEAGQALLSAISEGLDGSCSAYICPAEGGGLLSGPTIVVGVKDHDRVAEVLKKLAEKGRYTGDGKTAWKTWGICKKQFAGRDIYYATHLDGVQVCTLTWCLTDKRFVCAFSPQAVKSYLLREGRKSSLADKPAVAEALKAQRQPHAFAYEDSQQTLQTVYPLVQPFLNAMAANGSEKSDGPDPTLLPAMPTLAKYLRQTVVGVRVIPEGVDVTVRESLPGGNLWAVLWIGGVSALPADLGLQDHVFARKSSFFDGEEDEEKKTEITSPNSDSPKSNVDTSPGHPLLEQPRSIKAMTKPNREVDALPGSETGKSVREDSNVFAHTSFFSDERDVQQKTELKTPNGKTSALPGMPTGKSFGAGKLTLQATLTGHKSFVRSAAFSPDGKTLASGCCDDTVKLWDLATGRNIATLDAHSDVIAVAFSPDGKKLASGSLDGTVMLWDVTKGKNTTTLRPGSWVEAVQFNPDGTILASAGWDNRINLWNVATGKEIGALVGDDPDAPILKSLAFSPDGGVLAVGNGNDLPGTRPAVMLWNVKTRAKVARFQPYKDEGCFVECVAFSPDGKILAESNSDSIKLWDARTGKYIETLPDRSELISFSLGGKVLASAADRTIELWDMATRKKLVAIREVDLFQPLAFSPDGKTLAAANFDDFSIKLWKVKLGRAGG